jgi:hypothetical protein
MRRLAVVAVLVALSVSPVEAQGDDETGPALSALLALEREVLLRDVEILSLKMAKLQADLATAQARINERAAAFQIKVLAETDMPEGTTYAVETGAFTVPQVESEDESP